MDIQPGRVVIVNDEATTPDDCPPSVASQGYDQNHDDPIPESYAAARSNETAQAEFLSHVLSAFTL